MERLEARTAALYSPAGAAGSPVYPSAIPPKITSIAPRPEGM